MATLGTGYENKVLENKMTDLVNTKLDVKGLMTIDTSLTDSAGLKKVVNKYTYSGKVEKLAKGAKKLGIAQNSTILDLGSRDAKWIKFKEGKFHDMDWNTSCASSTGATVEMLLKFYNVKADELKYNSEKFAVTCGIFGMEKIMDSISSGEKPSDAISKFVHGIAFNAWNFCKKPEKIYLSGGFCENKCLVDSLKEYCELELLGRFVLCEGLF